jgi:hypothetical protein
MIDRLVGVHAYKSQESISEYGVSVLTQHLRNLGYVPPKNWDWRWRVDEKTEYTGTLTRRLAKYVHKAYKAKLNEKDLVTLGQLASANRVHANEYWFDFDRVLEWNSGDFADEDSCYFKTAGEPTRKALRACGWLAMRFFTDDTRTKGMGRVLLWPQGNHILAMNGYWNHGSRYGNYAPEVTARLVAMLAEWLKTGYKPVILDRNGYNGLIYPNSSRGYAIGDAEATEPIHRVILKDKVESP